jgi:uncharacterized protein YxjI
MKTLSDYYGKTLRLVQPSIWKRAFELRDGDEIIGMLTYPKFFSVSAQANIFDTKCEFYEPKWWKNLIEIREPGKELPIASFKPAILKSKEKFELPRGESVVLSSNLFSTTLEILDHYNSRLVVLKRKMNVKTTYEIHIEKRSEVLDRNPWVLLMIIYVEINKSRRRSAG